ncbi:MAG: hypothetical protein BYD32DRAFT_408740 [Podila humilis]|nr:MAG: hypothetical protein BYD32DRAFT_408740 [Podila humilis]
MQMAFLFFFFLFFTSFWLVCLLDQGIHGMILGFEQETTFFLSSFCFRYSLCCRRCFACPLYPFTLLGLKRLFVQCWEDARELLQVKKDDREDGDA